MTNQITIPRETFDAMREALERVNAVDDDCDILAPQLAELVALALDQAIDALAAANAVSEQAQEPKLPEYFAQYEYAPDFSVVVSVYRRRSDDVPELIHSEAMPKQIDDHPQATEPAWRPIESAPKDGSEILVIGTLHNLLVPKPERIVAAYKNGWWSGQHVVSNLTHWMPLTAPPKPEAP